MTENKIFDWMGCKHQSCESDTLLSLLSKLLEDSSNKYLSSLIFELSKLWRRKTWHYLKFWTRKTWHYLKIVKKNWE